MCRKLIYLVSFVLVLGLVGTNAALGDVLERSIAVGNDDAEEDLNPKKLGEIDMASTDLEFPYEDAGKVDPQLVALRFTNIAIPAGSSITAAWVRFDVDEIREGTLPANVLIEGELSPNPVGWPADTGPGNFGISTRPRTAASAAWSVPNWETTHEHGPNQTTTNIAAVIQEIIGQPGWASGNALVLIFRDDPANPSTGSRCAECFEGAGTNVDQIPLLHIEFAEAVAPPPVVAPAWKNTDVGTPTPGSASYDAATGTWTVTANGNDIWSTADNFHYVYRYLKGDGEIVARVTGIGPGTDPWAKAGVMIRDTLNPGSAFAAVYVTPTDPNGKPINGCRYQARLGTGISATSDTSVATAEQKAIIAPYWVKIERVGNALNTYYSSDPAIDPWHLIVWSPQTIAMVDPVYIGLAVTSHKDGELRTATLDNVSCAGDIYDVQLTAHNPAPADAAAGVPVDSTLGWIPADTAATYDVYFGTVNPPALVGNQAATSYNPGILRVATTYYWQINAVEADGVTVHAGPVWSFTTSPTNILINQRITDPNNDAEEHVANGNIELDSSDLELAYEDSGTPAKDEQVNGLRYVNIALPKGALVTNAYVEFEVDETKGGTAPVNLIIEGELTAAPFVKVAKNITSRTSLTTAKVNWSVPNWTANNVKFQTPDISSIIQEIISQEGWVSGNALILLFRDDKSNPSTGIRCAESVEGEAAAAPLLHIDAINEKATNPNPANGATGVAADATLSWRPGASAATHNVYFGTSSPPALVGNQAAASYNPGPLQGGTTYYWQIDEVAADGVTITPGDLWSFTTLSLIVIDNRIANGDDDYEEYVSNGKMDSGSSDLELAYETGGTPAKDEQVIGLRFVNLAIPKGAQVTGAYVEIEVDKVNKVGSANPVNLIIEGELTPNAAPFVNTPFNILLRFSRTTAKVKWSIPSWTAENEKFQTPDISSIIQEIVNQEGWASGNAIVLIFRDDKDNPSTGLREAEAYEGEATAAPLLHITAIGQ